MYALWSAVCVQVSLAGLWLMPAIISTLLKFWRFLFIWICYSLVTGYLMSLCSHKKMHHSTPRKVCKHMGCIYDSILAMQAHVLSRDGRLGQGAGCSRAVRHCVGCTVSSDLHRQCLWLVLVLSTDR